MWRRRIHNRQLQIDPTRWGRPREPAWLRNGAASLLLAAAMLAMAGGMLLWHAARNL